jgi:hypothetical protein
VTFEEFVRAKGCEPEPLRPALDAARDEARGGGTTYLSTSQGADSFCHDHLERWWDEQSQARLVEWFVEHLTNVADRATREAVLARRRRYPEMLATYVEQEHVVRSSSRVERATRLVSDPLLQHAVDSLRDSHGNRDWLAAFCRRAVQKEEVRTALFGHASGHMGFESPLS